MDIKSRKLALIESFLAIENEEIISKIEHLLSSSMQMEGNFQPMSQKVFNQRIDQAMEDSKKGNIISSEDLKAKIQKWD